MAGFHATAARAELTIAQDGRSHYAIFHDPAAAATVKDAAKELQRVLERSTGAKLPVVTQPTARMIVLGDCAAANIAGYSGAALAYEHYRIGTAGQNIYIVGRDTADGETTPWSGVSRGTQFGVFTFLERVVGVRWIMPEDIGEEIPRHAILSVGPLNIAEGPVFGHRCVDIPDGVSTAWTLHHKVDATSSYGAIASSFVPFAGHAWERMMPESLRKKHPEWDAIGGDREKFCTNHPEAMKAFTSAAIAWLAANPGKHMVNVSPSDGQGYCRCERCRVMIEPDPHGQDSFTPLVLDSYNQLARSVAAQPAGVGKMVGGYAYGVTTYPPRQGMTLEPNVYIEVTPLNYYGMGLYKPAYYAEFEKLLTAWRSITGNIGYQNYCHWHRSESGAPYPPAVSVMKMQFPVLKKLGYKAVRETATLNWAYGGPNNYLLAKLLWNPEADVDALYQEWLGLAYGKGASPMAAIFAVLEEGFRDFKVNKESFDFHGNNYEIMADKIEAIYLPRLARIESLYQEALAAESEGRARQRIEMFGANMVAFHYHLRHGSWLKKPETSVFYRSDEDYRSFLATGAGTSLQGDGWFWFWRHLRSFKPGPARPVKEARTFAAERRTADVPRLDSKIAIVVDGRIDAAEWANAVVMKEFRLPNNKGPVGADTIVRVTYDATALYVAFECREDRLAEVNDIAAPANSPRIYDGNTAELFISFTDDQAEHYWHMAVTSSNSRWTGVRNIAGELTFTSATSRSNGAWTAELAIPFTNLGVQNPSGATARVNVARSRRIGELRENSSWNAVEKSFLEAKHFGQWRFAD